MQDVRSEERIFHVAALDSGGTDPMTEPSHRVVGREMTVKLSGLTADIRNGGCDGPGRRGAAALGKQRGRRVLAVNDIEANRILTKKTSSMIS